MIKLVENKQQDIINGEYPNDSVFGVLVKVSVKTLCYLLLLLAVLAVFICQRFPFTAMKFYYNMNDYQTAIVYAKNYVKNNDSGAKRHQAILYGIEMSDILFYNSAENRLKKAAGDFEYFTNVFAFSDNFEDKCVELDKYYQSKAQSMIAKVGLYSYKDYIYSSNAAARGVLGQNKLLGNGAYAGDDGYIDYDEIYRLFYDLANGDYIPNDLDGGLTDLAVILNQLSQNIIYGGGSLIYNGISTTLLYDFAAISIAGFDSEYNYFDDCISFGQTVKGLYLLDAAANFTQNTMAFFDRIGDTDELALAQEYFKVTVGDTAMLLHQYYDAVLNLTITG